MRYSTNLLRNTLLFAVAFFIVERFCHKQTEGFALHKIVSDFPFEAEWETPPPETSLEEIFQRPFSFLGSGGQCYAFVCSEGEYVIKFFKQHHMRPLPLIENLSLPPLLEKWKLKILNDRKKRSKERIFTSYKIAHDHLKEETGMVYLHLNKTNYLHTTLTLIDKIGNLHQINLDTTEFALQKYATLTFPHLKKLVKQGETEKAQACLRSLIDLIISRAQQGIGDVDLVLEKNFGFIDTTAVEIDLGSFTKDPHQQKPYVYKRSLFYETAPLKKWLAKRSPELLEYFNAQLNQELYTP